MGGHKLSAITTCFFDLDDTLYPHSTGIDGHMRELIREYMVDKLGFNPNTVDADNMHLYRKYGTTMAGLRAEGYKFSFDDWHNHVHVPLPYDSIRPDPELRSVLHSLPQRKYVFTNGDRGHAARCLARLGVEDCLHGVIAFEDIMATPPLRAFSERGTLPQDSDEDLWAGEKLTRAEVVASWQGKGGSLVCCKPQVEAFMRALTVAGATPEQSMMFDDSPSNIAGAKRVGMHTVLVGSTNHNAAADYCVASLHNIHAAIPELWEGLEVEDAECPCGKALVQEVSA